MIQTDNSTATFDIANTGARRVSKAFAFTGSGSEYFRIWIVNLLLTLVTLGVYSAWAKVRRNKYFHHNTVLEGSSFEYHGNPVAILKGRAIAVGLFIAYNLMIQSRSGWLAFGALIGLAAVLPWLLWKSLQFRAWNTSWRGVRFGFGGTIAEAYKTFLWWPFVTGVSLYTLLPLAHQRIKAWQHSRARFGQTSFAMAGGVRSFYAAYLIAVAAILGSLVAMGLFGVFAAFGGGKSAAGQAFLIVAGVFYLVTFTTGPMVAAKIFNTVWSQTQLGPHQFESTIPLGRAAFVGVSNLLGIVLTLGLFIPWAAVRWSKLRAEHLVVHAAGPLDEFAAATQLEAKAFGEGVADLGGFDLGL